MKNIHVVQQKRIKLLLEFHVVFLLTYLTACNSPLIQKSDADESMVIRSDSPGNDELELAARILRQNYVDAFTFLPGQDTSMEDMIYRLDPYSSFFSKKTSQQFDAKIHNHSSSFGCGFDEWIREDTPFVYRVNPYSYCKDNGLCLGDKLLALDSISLIGHSTGFIDSLFDANNAAQYILTILRPGEDTPRKLQYRQSKIPSESARFCCFMLDSTTAYLWFMNFDEGIADKVQYEVNFLHIDHPHFSNLIIDLRWNTGGLVNEAISMLSLFYQTNAPVIEARSEIHPENNSTYKTTRGALLKDLKLFVLTNENSYSASELFAGTLQDWDRAIILGQQTGGKGLVMQKRELVGGDALYFATSRYFLPSGRCVQIPYENGIQKSKQPESEKVVCNLLHSHEKQFRCNDNSFYTKDGRVVYGEMGIVPDILVPDCSNGYALGKTTATDRFVLEFELVDRYQKLLLQHETFESFYQAFPFGEAAKYVGQRIEELTGEHPKHEKSLALTRRLIFYVQKDYFGLGTQTPQTLQSDNLIAEAKRILSVDAAQAKKELATQVTKSQSKHKLRCVRRKANGLAIR